MTTIELRRTALHIHMEVSYSMLCVFPGRR